MKDVCKQHSLPHPDSNFTGSGLLGSLRKKWGSNAPYNGPDGIITRGDMKAISSYLQHEYPNNAVVILKRIFEEHAGPMPLTTLWKMTEELRANPRIANAFVTRFEKEMSQDVS